jgi:lysozyme
MKYLRICIIPGILILLLTVAIALLYFSGAWIPNLPSLATYPVRGIDVSHHQGEIDWKAIAAGQIRFAYIKSTEGADYSDPLFKQNWERTRAAGVLRGAYHFYVIDTAGSLQAEHFIATVPVDSSALPPAVDLELSGVNHDVKSVEKFQHELSVFLDAITAHYGTQPVIYTSGDFRDQYLKGMTIGPLWISEVLLTPKSDASKKWMFWQFSSKGRIPGINGFVDLDVFSGDAGKFEEFLTPVKRNE